MRLKRGSLLLVDLDPTKGHEQRGFRPCILVSDPDVSADQRFPMIGVVPVTSAPGRGPLYPPLQPGPSGLRIRSFALVDQVRSVDKRRVSRVFGCLAETELDAVDEGLRLFLGLSPRPGSGAGAVS